MRGKLLTPSREISKDYNEIFFHEDDDQRIAKLEMWTAKQIGEALMKEYPNRQWGVNVDIPGRMVIILCPSLSQRKGYHLFMKDGTIQDLQERAKQAAGEILERYGVSRDKIFRMDKIDEVGRLYTGEALGPDSEGIDPVKRNG